MLSSFVANSLKIFLLTILMEIHMRRYYFILSVFLSLMIVFLAIPSIGFAQHNQVRAVLFYSQSCGHCHMVITEVLPPLAEKYGESLYIVGIDVGHEIGNGLYQSAIEHFNIPDNRLGVPTLIIGETVLVGSLEIPEELPGLIEEGLKSGGVDWPEIPGLLDVMAHQIEASTEPATPKPQDTNSSVESSSVTMSNNPAFINRFNQDRVGNTFSIIILLGMLLSVIGVGYTSIKGEKSEILDWSKWIIPLISILGLFVASYLSYVEVTQSTAVCGPVGDCNTVQQSPYAKLFGFFPIGVLRVLGYIAIIIAWLLQYYGPSKFRKISTLGVWAMAWFGVLFSIYLTFLEPFVIGATCAWCLTSAIIMTIILLGSTEPAKLALEVDSEDFDEIHIFSQSEILD